jgi:hypothetical protein
MPLNSPNKIVLEIKGLGHVPSKKNKHYAAAKGVLLMDQETKEWMSRCQSSFVFQLFSICQTNESATVTGHSLRSLIASLPPDDNWKVISEEAVKAVRVPKGEEGAVITIERIT